MWNDPEYTDNSGEEAGRHLTRQPGDSFDIGTHTVIYTAWDSSGNLASCSILVTVTGL